MPSVLLFDYIRPPLVTDESGVMPPWGYSQDDNTVLAGVLEELRKGKLVASARQGPFGAVREPADFWHSISWADVDWELSAVPAHGLVAVRIRRAYRTTQSMPEDVDAIRQPSHDVRTLRSSGPESDKVLPVLRLARQDIKNRGSDLVLREKGELWLEVYGKKVGAKRTATLNARRLLRWEYGVDTSWTPTASELRLLQMSKDS